MRGVWLLGALLGCSASSEGPPPSSAGDEARPVVRAEPAGSYTARAEDAVCPEIRRFGDPAEPNVLVLSNGEQARTFHLAEVEASVRQDTVVVHLPELAIQRLSLDEGGRGRFEGSGWRHLELHIPLEGGPEREGALSHWSLGPTLDCMPFPASRQPVVTRWPAAVTVQSLELPDPGQRGGRLVAEFEVRPPGEGALAISGRLQLDELVSRQGPQPEAPIGRFAGETGPQPIRGGQAYHRRAERKLEFHLFLSPPDGETLGATDWGNKLHRFDGAPGIYATYWERDPNFVYEITALGQGRLDAVVYQVDGADFATPGFQRDVFGAPQTNLEPVFLEAVPEGAVELARFEGLPVKVRGGRATARYLVPVDDPQDQLPAVPLSLAGPPGALDGFSLTWEGRPDAEVAYAPSADEPGRWALRVVDAGGEVRFDMAAASPRPVLASWTAGDEAFKARWDEQGVRMQTGSGLSRDLPLPPGAIDGRQLPGLLPLLPLEAGLSMHFPVYYPGRDHERERWGALRVLGVDAQGGEPIFRVWLADGRSTNLLHLRQAPPHLVKRARVAR